MINKKKINLQFLIFRAIDHGIPISNTGEFDPEILEPKEIEIKGLFFK